MNPKLLLFLPLILICNGCTSTMKDGQTNVTDRTIEFREIEDFRLLIAEPEQIKHWQAEGVCVIYIPFKPLRNQVPFAEIAVTNGMSISDVVNTAFREGKRPKSQVRRFGRNAITQTALFWEIEQQKREETLVVPGDILLIQPRQ